MSSLNRSQLTTFQALAIASQFGAMLAAAVSLGLFGGQWLDSQLHTSVVFTLIGVFMGFAAAVTSTVTAYRLVLRRNARGTAGAEPGEATELKIQNQAGRERD